ncbi:MAG: hypothetical protein M3O34_18615 [Chloroflexota bacterium]|nr:hypothetical protein [Chloroflexota bacterium]
MGLGDTIRGWLDPPAESRQTSPVRSGTGGAGAESPVGGTGVLGAGTSATDSPKELDPNVHEWLSRELPILEAEGLLEPSQATALARRYGVTPAAATPSAHRPMPVPVISPGTAVEQRISTAPAARAPTPSLAPFLVLDQATWSDMARCGS